MSRADAIAIDDADQVATVLRPISAGETVLVSTPKGPLQVIAVEPVPIFHKIALRPLRQGADILKYGESIGLLTADVERGVHVHIHNLRSKRAAKET